jgi:uncharacterized protein
MKPLLTLAALLALGAGFAQDALLGTWQGEIGPGVLNLGVRAAFTEENGELRGTLDIPAQGALALPLRIEAATDAGATFVIEGVPGNATFEGTLQGDTLEGTFTQAGQSFPFALTRAEGVEPAAVPVVPELLGDWSGIIDPEGMQQSVGLRVEEVDGGMVAALVFPEQAASVPVRLETASATELRFVIEGAPGDQRFVGTVQEGVIEGEFSAYGESYPARLERGGDLSLRRPQEPVPPFPYITEEVSVSSGDIALAGTLAIPEGMGPFPAVVFITGSGPQDRDEALFGHRPFLVIADALARAGVASLRVDDRGVGGSGGSFETASYADFAADVQAQVAYLQERPEIDAARIGLLGHSEGGYIAPLAIAQGTPAAFFIGLAAPSVSGLEVLRLQNLMIYRDGGADDALIAQQLAYLDALHTAVTEDRLDDVRTLVREQVALQLADLPENERPNEELAAQITEAQVASVDAPWFRDFLVFDPQPYLRTLTIPTLAIYGKMDIQVPAVQSSGVMEGTLRRAGNPDVTVVSFEHLNHLLQPSQAGGITEYGLTETTIAPEVLDLIVGWVSERFLD